MTTNSGRIIGGNPVEAGAQPNICSLYYSWLGISNGHTCAASLLTQTKLLTAGHCLTELPSSGVYDARCGLLKLSDTSNMQQRRVARSIVHPEYQGGVNPFDIAIMFVDTPFEWNALVQPGNLPTAPCAYGDVLLVGWGYDESGTTPDHLLQATKTHITIDQCEAALTGLLGSNHPLDRSGFSNVCTGGLPQGGLSACSGDSGGPLYQGDVQCGVVSWGITPCGYSGAPSVYANTYNLRGWIDAQS